MIIVESSLANTQVNNIEGRERLLIEIGYHHIYFDGHNQYYIADEHTELDEAFLTLPKYSDHFKRVSDELLEKHAQCPQNEWNAVKIRLEEMTREVATVKISANHLEALLCESTDALISIQAECNVAKNNFDKQNHSSRHLRIVADMMTKKLHSIYASISRKIGRPLRKLMQMFQWVLYQPIRLLILVLRLPGQAAKLITLEVMRYVLKSASLKAAIILWLNKYPGLNDKLKQFSQKHDLISKQPLHKRAPKWIALKMMRYVIEHESLKVSIISWLNKHPVLNSKLRQFSRIHDLLPGQSDKANQVVEPHEISDALYNEDISHLTPTARLIYMELKTTLKQRQHENDICA
jgi:hypothetical protein